jgi:pimeloyl-ACP methyl ester carboxylesterase
MGSNARWSDGWSVKETGPMDGEHTVLLLPGGMCTTVFYDELVATLSDHDASLRLVAATLPGHGGTPAPDDVSIDNYARLASDLAGECGADVVVGHSIGGNVALEMGLSHQFDGPLVLLSPSFSRQDEDRFLRTADRVAGVIGAAPYRLMLAMVGLMMKDVKVSADRQTELAGELRRNNPRFCRRAIRAYLMYLDRSGSLPRRLSESGVPTWVAFGDHGDVGLADHERALLEGSANVTMVTISDAGHLTLNEQPAQVAEVVLAAVARAER